MTKENKKIRDSLFVSLFSTCENAKENFISLYNAITDSNLKPEETTVEDIHIDQVVYKDYTNDVSKLVNNRIVVLLEHQSTINENMPLRCLEYVTRIYEKYTTYDNKFRRKLIKIPAPEFYVLYNGTDNYPVEKELKLSDAFIVRQETFPLEISVKVININSSKNEQLLKKSMMLHDYQALIELYRDACKAKIENPLTYAVNRGIELNLLGSYLPRYSSEVKNMIMTEYDYDLDIKVQRQEEHEIAFAEGRAESKLQDAVIAVKDFEIPIEKVAEKFGVPLEDLQNALQN